MSKSKVFTFLILSILLITGTNLQAKKYKGFIIKDGDTTAVTIRAMKNPLTGFPNFVSLQCLVKVRLQDGTDTTYSAYDLDAFIIKIKKKDYVMKSVDLKALIKVEKSGSPLRKLFSSRKYRESQFYTPESFRIFLQVLETGYADLYYFHYYSENRTTSNSAARPAGNLNYAEDYILKAHNKDFYVVRNTFSFKKDASAYFNDCEQLAINILSDRYTFRNIRQIVRYYNKYKVKNPDN
jgi:hypothetical protein